MAKKTFNIGENCKNGVISVEITGKKISVINRLWDTSKGYSRTSNQTTSKEMSRTTVQADGDNAYRDLYDYLSDLTTHYYSETVIGWIKTNVELKPTSMW